MTTPTDPMRQGRAAKILSLKLNYSGKVMTRREFVEQSFREGKIATWTLLTTRRGEQWHWLIGDYEATKTEVDYLTHLGQQSAPPVLHFLTEGELENYLADEEQAIVDYLTANNRVYATTHKQALHASH